MKLYVGNLAWSIDDKALAALFESYGVDEANVIVDKFSKRSKGFGFVTINDEDSAKKAMADMDQKEIEGRALNVNEARPMTPRDDDRAPRGESSEAPMADAEAIEDAQSNE
ncbi:RNA-binding protein [archaeon]|jgi:RNA recognition motif-containing protein|nr:RNA-binding protein [archaeon]MBT6182815.1 RNA-binding protein [archaeon]MBT6606382.1 RNA-binding protein [archaeon]MBT7251449.1 RNA-binding protein [archaeon]MBT7661235.1 RNA-binding protein [archaeon]